LEHQGFEFFREAGNHTVYINRSAGKSSSIPRHREVNDFLAHKICADAEPNGVIDVTRRNVATSRPLNQLAGHRLDWVFPPQREELFSILSPRPLWDVHYHNRELRKHL
jgi:mRNA interferase HicA